jgi:hypothetical protein
MDAPTKAKKEFASARLMLSRQHYALELLEYVAAHPNFEPATGALVQRPELLDDFDSAVMTDRGIRTRDYFIASGIDVPNEVEVYFTRERDTTTDIPPGWCVDVCTHTATMNIIEHLDSTGWHSGPC